MSEYIIRCVEEPDAYWSNDDGWVDRASATRFSQTESHELSLPIGGEWVSEHKERM